MKSSGEYFEDSRIGWCVHESAKTFSHFRDLIVALTASPSAADNDYIVSIRPLLKFICDRSSTMLLLIQNDCLWDAEILMRPILEATLRVSFLSYTTAEERRIRIREFWEDLPEINSLKQSERARTTKNRTAKSQDVSEIFEAIILSETEEEKLRKKWPKRTRQQLEQKWSFSEIIRDLETFKTSSFNLKTIRSLVHNYGISSHLIHADETGVGLPIDRDRREEVERQKLIRAHAARLLSDQLSYIFATTSAVSHAIGQPQSAVNKLFDGAKKLFTELDLMAVEFYQQIKH